VINADSHRLSTETVNEQVEVEPAFVVTYMVNV